MAAQDLLEAKDRLLQLMEEKGIDTAKFEADFQEGLFVVTGIMWKFQEAGIDIDAVEVKSFIIDLLSEQAQEAHEAGENMFSVGLKYHAILLSEQCEEWFKRERLPLTIREVRENGEWGPLVEYLADGEPITEELRYLLAEMLSGKIKRAKGRPKSIKPFLRAGQMIADVQRLEHQGWLTEAAVKQVALEYKVSDRTVYRALDLDPVRRVR